MIAGLCFSGTFTVFGPQSFVRDSSTPDTITSQFSVLNPQTTYTLQIYNGLQDSLAERVSSSIFTINGVIVVGAQGSIKTRGMWRRKSRLR